MQTIKEKKSLYRARKFGLYAKVAGREVTFGVRDISGESIGLDVQAGALRPGMRFTVYVFCGDLPVASDLRVEVRHFSRGYAKCRYVDLTQGQAKCLQKIVAGRYVLGAPLKSRRSA